MTASRTTYSGVAQAIHWISALLIVTMIGLGLVMTRIDADTAQQALYRAHVTIGLAVLALTAIRLAWLVFHRWPAPPPSLASVQAKLFIGNHVLLYLVLIVMLSSGVGMLALSGLPSPLGVVPADIEDVPPRLIHDILSKVFIGLLVMHILGVLEYQLHKGDTLSRMGIRWLARRSTSTDSSGE